VAVSAPLDLEIAAKQLDFGWNKLIYTRDFLRTMKRKVLEKISTHGLELDARLIRCSSTFREFDNLYTAPAHGFKDATDYWTLSSSRPWLRQIKVRTLLINARNDPFFPGDALPGRSEVSETVSLEYPESGGHVGFVSGDFPGHLEWLPRRMLHFFGIG
jgi:predicted alpha/beta-fold hydrolase